MVNFFQANIIKLSHKFFEKKTNKLEFFSKYCYFDLKNINSCFIFQNMFYTEI